MTRVSLLFVSFSKVIVHINNRPVQIENNKDILHRFQFVSFGSSVSIVLLSKLPYKQSFQFDFRI